MIPRSSPSTAPLSSPPSSPRSSPSMTPRLTFKYRLSDKDLDALIFVTNDNDLEHMMHEYDRLYHPNLKPIRMRLFLFILSNSNPNSYFSSKRGCFIEALNLGPIPSQPIHEGIVVDTYLQVERFKR
ncbi:hypothetical protein AAZV13_01G155900 [Glycine max]